MAKAILENYNGYPAIMIDSKPYPPMMATINTRQDKEVILNSEYFQKLGKSGIKIFFIICDTDWLMPGSFELFKKEAETVLKAVPDAYFMLRIGLHPPLSWMEENPDEILLFSDSQREPVYLRTETYKAQLPGMYSLCSSKWREAAGKALMETYDKVEALPYADRIIGYFLAAGNTSEWYYSGANKPGAYGDFSEAFRRNFEEYLRETYKTEEDLKEAWNDPNASFTHPHIPTPQERKFIFDVDNAIKSPKYSQPSDPLSEPPKDKSFIGIFSNLDNSKNTFDFLRAWHTGSAKSVNYFAKLIKDRSREKLVGAFYGSTGCIDFTYGGTSAASLDILDKGNVDFFAAPNVYQNRQLGGFAGLREPADSFRLRNCMYIVEEDTRTHEENPYFGDLYEVFSLEDTLNIMKRDFGRNLCEDLNAWWFDQHIGGGRYRHDDVCALIKRQQQVIKEAYEKNRIKQNEIAFVFDEESILAVSFRTNTYSVELMRDYEISLIGASADSYYHNDLSKANMPSYKLYVFCNTFVLNEKERKDIVNKLKKDNAVALWLYAPGIIDPDTKPYFDIKHIKELTGFEVEMKEAVVTPKFKINGTPHSLTENLDKGQIYGYNYRFRQNNINHSLLDNTQLLYPAFYSVDKDAQNLAYFLQQADMPALSIKQMDGWTSVFCGARMLRNDVLRETARFAGCHIFCESNDVIYASRNYITIHAASTGEKTLKFPKACTPFEIYEEKNYGENVTAINFNLLKGETKTFELN